MPCDVRPGRAERIIMRCAYCQKHAETASQLCDACKYGPKGDTPYITHAIDNEWDRCNPHPSLYARCGKSRVTFTSHEWIASEFQAVTCEKCLRFIAESTRKGGETHMKPLITVAHLGAWLVPGGVDGKHMPLGTVFSTKELSPGSHDIYAGDAGCIIHNENGIKPHTSYRIVGVDHTNWTLEEVEAVPQIIVKHANAKVNQGIEKQGKDVPIGTVIAFRESGPGSTWLYLDANTGGQGIDATASPVKPIVGVHYKIVANNWLSHPTGTWTLEETQEPLTGSQPSSRLFVTIPPDSSLDVSKRAYGYIGAQFVIKAVGSYTTIQTNENVYLDAANCLLTAFRVGYRYIVVNVQDLTLEVREDGVAPPVFVEPIPSTGVVIDTPLPKASSIMAVFSGVVVRTKTVQAGEGVATGVAKPDVIYSTPKPVSAASVEQAKSVVLAQAIVALKGELDLEDVTKPVVVQLAQFNL